MVALAGVACTSGGGQPAKTNQASGPVQLTMWQPYGKLAGAGETPNYEYNSMLALVKEYEKAHPNVTINLVNLNPDYTLQKLTPALQGGQPPDIAYMYGSNMPQVATSPQLVDLTQFVRQTPSYNWNDFWTGERAVCTVNGKIFGVPALVDNLAVVYNKTLFQKAGLALPSPGWTWDDLVADAKALTNKSQKRFGLAFPVDGSETTVWQYEAMLWEAGGHILSSDDKQAVFDQAGGVRALTVLQQVAPYAYLDFNPDAGRSEQLFNSGKIGMIITGPWDLSSFPNVKYGVDFMPAFTGLNDHQTIAGPDNWVIFNNGSAQVSAAEHFLAWFTSPEQVLRDSVADSHLPTRASVMKMPAFNTFFTKYPGERVYVENLANVKQARPQIAAYPRVSQTLGHAIVSAMLNKSTPQAALTQAAQQADTILATG
jgi:multiple sugar transport system substrate-binding protein